MMTAMSDVDEARRVVAKAECAMHGHDYDILNTVGGGPVAIYCVQGGVGCGAGPWDVVERKR